MVLEESSQLSPAVRDVDIDKRYLSVSTSLAAARDRAAIEALVGDRCPTVTGIFGSRGLGDVAGSYGYEGR
jgi:hypothetical protein